MYESILKDIGRSYIVSSLLPAAIFVVLAVLIFSGLLPAELIAKVSKNSLPFGSMVVTMILFSVWLGFILYSSQNYIIQFFEGYNLPKPIREQLKNNKVSKNKEFLEKISNSKKTYLDLLQKTKSIKGVDTENLRGQLNQVYIQYTNYLRELDFNFPLNKKDLLPTRLGNILRASEYYPNERYGFDGVTLWERISKIVPKEFDDGLEEKNNQFIFLINSTLLIGLLTVLTLLVPLGLLLIFSYQFLCNSRLLICRNIYPSIFDNYSTNVISLILIYIGISLFLFLICWKLYLFTLGAAKDFSSYIRSGFDLYRHPLLQQLHLPLPDTLKREQQVWKQIDEFYLAGESVNGINFRYLHPEAEKKTKIEVSKNTSFALMGGLGITLTLLLRFFCNQRARRQV